MMNAPDYIEEQALIALYRAVTDAIIATQPKNPDDFSDFEKVFPGFSSISQENSNESF